MKKDPMNVEELILDIEAANSLLGNKLETIQISKDRWADLEKDLGSRVMYGSSLHGVNDKISIMLSGRYGEIVIYKFP